MRPHPILFLVAGLTMAACEESPGPSGDGTLVVSTSTEGNIPDDDGYLLAVDGVDSLALDPTGSAEVDIPAGRHILRLLGVAEQCSVSPGTSLAVNIPPEGRTQVAFEVSCLGTGARITVSTTGLDIDLNGYRVAVDGNDWAPIASNGTALTQLEPGSRTIGLTALAPNCTIDGPGSRTVTIVDTEVVPIEFAVVCTATSGVIGVVVEAAGIDREGEYAATVDGTRHPVQLGQPTYLTGVAPGDHVVTLVAPANCSVQTDPQSITLTAGGMVRDTVEVSFSVSCVSRLGTVQVMASTSGTIPAHDYSVWICEVGFYCQFYPYLLGALNPNGTLVAQVQPGSYEVWLSDVPGNCGVVGPSSFAIALRDTLNLGYTVACL